MTSVLYRAKRKDNLEWVYGYYRKMTVRYHLGEKTVHIIYPADCVNYPYEADEYYEVIPETVCRLLYHADYDSAYECPRIFQGDIVTIWRSKADIDREKPIGNAVVLDEHSVSETERGLGRWFTQDTTRVRVIGNAYDNPELMEGYCLSHFVTSLREYPGDPDNYIKQHRYLSEKYDIHGAHACCYMCNFENDYICHTFNGGCDRIDICRKIREEGD